MQWCHAPALHITRYNGEKKRFICVSYSWIRLVIGMNHAASQYQTASYRNVGWTDSRINQRYQGWIRIGWKGEAGVGGCQFDWSPAGLPGLPTFYFCMLKVSCTTTDIHSLHLAKSLEYAARNWMNLAALPAHRLHKAILVLRLFLTFACLTFWASLWTATFALYTCCSYFKGPQEWTKLAAAKTGSFWNHSAHCPVGSLSTLTWHLMRLHFHLAWISWEIHIQNIMSALRHTMAY